MTSSFSRSESSASCLLFLLFCGICDFVVGQRTSSIASSFCLLAGGCKFSLVDLVTRKALVGCTCPLEALLREEGAMMVFCFNRGRCDKMTEKIYSTILVQHRTSATMQDLKLRNGSYIRSLTRRTREDA